MKIFKLFISLFLILSISLINSIAAISVSDGSAFVTKAEFAADLNNLSNRMSSLENSLDAKIDSLVSSYLSRNGIWNGETQTHSLTLNVGTAFDISKDKSDTVIAKDENGYVSTVIIGTDSVKVNGTQKGSNGAVIYTTASQKFCMGIASKFMKMSKAGLLNFFIKFEGNNEQFNEVGINVLEYGYSNRLNGITGIAGIVLSKGDEYNFNNVNSIWVSSSLYGFGSGSSTTAGILDRVYVPFPFGSLNLLGFVDKDDELNLGFVVSAFGAYYQIKQWRTLNEGGYKITNIKASVY